MSNLRKQYLSSDVPMPRRTAYRRRKEAERAAMAQDETSSESDAEPGETDRRFSGVTEPQETSSSASNVQNSDLSDANNGSASMAEVMSVWSGDSEGGREQEPRCQVSEILEDNSSNTEPYESDENIEDLNQLGNHTDIEEEDSDRQSVVSQESVEGQNRPPQIPVPNEDGNNHVERLLADRLCQCTTTTEGDAFLMCLALGMRHNLTWVALVDILKLINRLFGKDVIHASKHYLLKLFESGKESTIIHIYCPKCEAYLGTKDFVREEEILQCDCGEAVKDFASSSSYFVSVNLKDQFQTLMTLPGVAQEILTHRFERQKSSDEALEDVYDGDAYKFFCEPGQPLSDPKNISVTMNTDGMALGSSSSQSAWPIFMYVNELSHKNRQKNIIFAGMWVGKKQPNMRIFLTPFVNEMKQLSEVGFDWMDGNGEMQTSKVLPLIAVLDSGARYKFLNLISYSGYYGCTFCYQKAENTSKGRRFTVVDEPAPLRTQESMIADMQRSHANRNHPNKKERVYKGCRGITPLIDLHPYLNLGKGVIVDFMHNALLGVARYHTKLVLDTARAPFYAGDPDKLNIMNGRLSNIRPPKTITRTPRELTDVKIWHANEWRSYLLFYGLLCYDGVLKKKYLVHYAMLSSAFYILLQKSISLHELQVAEIYLLQYVYLMQTHFGKTCMRYNIHLLLHVIKSVKDWGPVWAQNTFVFEGENRHLAQMHTSPGRVALQLTRRYLTFSKFPKLCETYASNETPLHFIEELTGKRLHSFLRCGETVLIGKGQVHIFDQVESLCLNSVGIVPGMYNALSYSKALHTGVRLTTKQYSEGKKNDDSWVKIKNGARGSIEKIYHLQSQERQIIVFFLREIIIDSNPILRTPDVTVTHIKRVEGTGELKVVKPSDIVGQCIYMNLDNGKFITDMPYGCYGD